MRIARIFGTPLRVDASWIFVFALLVWTLSSPQGPFGEVDGVWRIVTAVAATLALFACVVLHELAHTAVARSYRIKTEEIVLFAFGGVSRMERVGATPAAEAHIAIAGPVVSFGVAAILASAAPLFAASNAVFAALMYLALINAVLAGFNLIPAFPVDGGRLVHALAWQVTRDHARATAVAVKISIALGVAAAAAGVLLLFSGYVLDGVWIALIAWFVIRSAQTEYAVDVEIGPLASVRCSELLDPAAATFQPDTTCEQALARMIETRRRAAAVTVGRRLLGMLSMEDFSKLGTRDPRYVYVGAIMTPASELHKVLPDVSGLEAFKELASSGHPQLPVVDKHGMLLGFVSRDTLSRVLSFQREERPHVVRSKNS